MTLLLSTPAGDARDAADILRRSKVIGIGSPRASIESNFALRELVGAENFYTGIARGEDVCNWR